MDPSGRRRYLDGLISGLETNLEQRHRDRSRTGSDTRGISHRTTAATEFPGPGTSDRFEPSPQSCRLKRQAIGYLLEPSTIPVIEASKSRSDSLPNTWPFLNPPHRAFACCQFSVEQSRAQAQTTRIPSRRVWARASLGSCRRGVRTSWCGHCRASDHGGRSS